MIFKLIWQTLLTTALTGVLLFGGAGTIHWTAAWVYLIEFVALASFIGIRLLTESPALLKERVGSPLQEGQPSGDKTFMSIMMAFWAAWMVFMGLDAVRFGWSQVPFAVQVTGAVVLALSLYAAYRAMLENRFAAPVVKIQDQQRVIDTGPYSVVRHPMYAGALPYFIGIPLLLGSWWGLLAFPLAVVGLALRIGIEEKTLRDALPGYDDYARRVRFRLLPGVW